MFLTVLSQITEASDTLASASEAVQENIDQEVTIFELIVKGGWVMIPMFLLAAWAIFLFIERYLTIRKANKSSDGFIDEVKGYVASGDVQSATIVCQNEGTPAARMIEKGISRIGSPLKDIEASVENVGKIEINRLEKNLSTLATISGAAPMIGFLGTVLGMIQAFIVMAQKEVADVTSMAEGIYQSMITTATGLIVGVIAYMAYNYLTALVQKVIHNIEYSSIEFIDLLQEPQQ